jgi:hypothetical protein
MNNNYAFSAVQYPVSRSCRPLDATPRLAKACDRYEATKDKPDSEVKRKAFRELESIVWHERQVRHKGIVYSWHEGEGTFVRREEKPRPRGLIGGGPRIYSTGTERKGRCGR